MNRNEINVTLHNLDVNAKGFDFLRDNLVSQYTPPAERAAEKLRDLCARSQGDVVALVYQAITVERPVCGWTVAEMFTLGFRNDSSPTFLDANVIQTAELDSENIDVQPIPPDVFMNSVDEFVELNKYRHYVSAGGRNTQQCIGLLYKVQTMLRSLKLSDYKLATSYEADTGLFSITLDRTNPGEVVVTVTISIQSGVMLEVKTEAEPTVAESA